MNLPHASELRRTGRQALDRAPGDPRKLILVYAGIAAILSTISLLLGFYLDHQIAGTGGLSGMGLRSMLSTVQMLLPFVTSVVLLGLQLGYHIGILRILRGQSADHRTLPLGFARFAPMFCVTLLQTLMAAACMFIALYLSAIIFSTLPIAKDFIELVQPMIDSSSMLTGAIELDPATMDVMMAAMKPMLWIYPPIAAVLTVPMLYRYRMAIFCLSEDFRVGTMAALRRSRTLLHRKRFSLFRLDLSLWWYYGLLILAAVLSNGDLIAAYVGISLPLDANAAYLLFGILGIAAQFAVQYYCMNGVTATYAAAYEALQEE